jgi:DNA-binding NarL/FixJ family response regulator
LRAKVGEEAVDRALAVSAPLSDAQVTALLDELETHLCTSHPGVDASESARSQHLLTAREEAVLRLLAQGATNRTIADQLFISERTVENHVQHIFTKLVVTNRAGAAAWAVRHGVA